MNNDSVLHVSTTFYSNIALAVQPNMSEVWVGHRLVLTCTSLDIDLRLDSEIFWHKRPNDTHSIQNDNSSQLVINATTIHQSGLYFCCTLSKFDQGRVCSPDANVKVKG